MPSGKRIAGQEVASLDSASMKGRRRNRGGEDEAEDLDAILNSVDGDDTGKRRSSRNGSGIVPYLCFVWLLTRPLPSDGESEFVIGNMPPPPVFSRISSKRLSPFVNLSQHALYVSSDPRVARHF